MKNTKGFTLIELMVALAMSLFLIGGVLLMYSSAKSTFSDSSRLSRMQENIRFASDYLVRDIRNAGFRDEFSITVGEVTSIQNSIAQLSNDGGRLTIRYAGRGHCQKSFDQYLVVENSYFLDTESGELRCEGRAVPPADDDPEGSMALVDGLTSVAFELVMADATSTRTNSNTTCSDNPTQPLSARCLGVYVGLEFEGLQELDGSGGNESRYVELFAAFRNSAINHIFRNLDS